MKIHNGLGFKMLLTIVLLLVLTPNAAATKWIKLEPEQVAEKAQLIVKGKYVITDDKSNWKGQGFWIPFDFIVDDYYRGSGAEHIRAAIEMNDVGWVKEFQDNGGYFYLFLSAKEQDYWIPVGGPNGMIQIEEGKITNRSSQEVSYYNNLLAELKLNGEETAEENKNESPVENSSKASSDTKKPNWISLGLVVLGTFVVIYTIGRRASS